ncbi:amino acid ABC transporter ATP-binding protein [Acetobacter sp.]|jgi:general L-amino acid transport system ATP-binding protein|uniref:amino acid ABC transporter ATP-binding protein n=1 Tax=Acetobacter sp. TaxID=440 RepID=UPI0025B89674|nr:amino acid ABC transporter ATP-binding protein [Acetobacter sp.]MCH4091378.1 amino acid ABC transporter ATP-binding protein [Acetobacter sp.]MCI1299356.1 amino acid ABC transporter ATP-binding protein [Acetobacter sp.]MCI1316640.1 amino acid ABC transporter ATP-binding protein [Acetobacter sp.]
MVSDTAPNPDIRISLRNLSKFYGEFLALDRLDLDIDQGEKIVVLGPSGSGKSTFIRCFNRIEPHDSGTLMIDGQVIDDKTDLAALRGRVGMVFQNYNLFPHLTVLDNCTLAPRLVRGASRQQAEEDARRYLALVGIGEQAGKYPIQLSGGQQQRVAIARALSMNPEIILFDEPTAALDPEAISGVVAIIDELAAQQITIICVTHEMGFARRIADRIVFMDKGSILEVAPPQEFFTAPRTERARTFLNQMIQF